MYRAKKITKQEKTAFYQELNMVLEALIQGESDWLANMANTAGLIFDQLVDINWAGFYLVKGNELVLGPFQGKPACTRIVMGKGVCGTSAAQGKTLIVADVHKFPGHIACDTRSRSEIVLPFTSGQLRGVLDIDSPILNRFDEDDARGLEQVVNLLLTNSEIKIRG